jgi:hypothetical protein
VREGERWGGLGSFRKMNRERVRITEESRY